MRGDFAANDFGTVSRSIGKYELFGLLNLPEYPLRSKKMFDRRRRVELA